jgi:hypothetical protein
MAPLVVVEILEANKFVLQVASIPKRDEVEILSPDCADKSLHARMRNRQVGHSLHFGYIEDSNVSPPLVESEQRIMIAADIFRRSSSTDRMVEHPAQRWSIDAPSLYTKADDSTRELIHDDEYPVAF